MCHKIAQHVYFLCKKITLLIIKKYLFYLHRDIDGVDPLEDGSVSLDFSEVSTSVALEPGILDLQLAVFLLQVVSLLPLGVQLE